MSQEENTRAKKFTEDRRRAEADRAYVTKLTKSCKKAIVEAFTNYPSLAAVTKENLESMAAEKESETPAAVQPTTREEELKIAVVAAASLANAMDPRRQLLAELGGSQGERRVADPTLLEEAREESDGLVLIEGASAEDGDMFSVARGSQPLGDGKIAKKPDEAKTGFEVFPAQIQVDSVDALVPTPGASVRVRKRKSQQAVTDSGGQGANTQANIGTQQVHKKSKDPRLASLAEIGERSACYIMFY